MIEGGAWCETYGDFVAWLNEAGLTVENLPGWPDAVPVRVLVVPPGRLLLEKVSSRTYRRFQDMVGRGQKRLRAVSLGQLQAMHEVTVTAVDVDKLQAWQRKNNGFKTWQAVEA